MDRSFNSITVDGDTSTNDMVAVFASGASGVRVDESPLSLLRFEEALLAVLTDLAKLVAKDGEGASRLITVTVTGAATGEDALLAARTIASSPLVKTAVPLSPTTTKMLAAVVAPADEAVAPPVGELAP